MYYNPNQQYAAFPQQVPPAPIGSVYNASPQPYYGYGTQQWQNQYNSRGIYSATTGNNVYGLSGNYLSPYLNNPTQTSYVPPTNNVGFGGGYYSGNYGIVNPYLYQKQYEEQQKAQRKYEEDQRIIDKMMLKSHYAYIGDPKTDEELDEMMSPPQSQYEDQQHIEWAYLNEEERADCKEKILMEDNLRDNFQNIAVMQTRPPQQYYSVDQCLVLNNINFVHNFYKSIAPEDMSLADYFTVAVPKIYDFQDMIAMKQYQSNLRQEYNSAQYNALLNKHKSQFGSVFGMNSPNIDDQEIKLPPELQISDETRQRRKAAFLESIKAQMAV